MKTKTSSLFATLKKFQRDKKIFYSFFLFVALPITLISTILSVKFYLSTISYAFSFLLYTFMFLFINSYVVLAKIHKEKKLSFFIVLKLIPAILPSIIFPTLIYALAIVIAEYFFLITPFLLFVFFPIVSFVPLFNKNISLTELVNENTYYKKTETGKKSLQTILILSVISVIAIFTIRNLILHPFLRTSSFTNIQILGIIFALANKLIVVITYFIIYLTMVNLYSINNFNFPETVLNFAYNIFYDKKNERSSRRSFKPKRKFNKKHKKENSKIDFETNYKTEKKETKEHNRFLEDDSYNRFEDTKF